MHYNGFNLEGQLKSVDIPSKLEHKLLTSPDLQAFEKAPPWTL